jgi:dienelactone hydrolase
MTAPAPQPLYLDTTRDPVFVTLHRPAAHAARDTAVMICPPFGWDEVCSYRSLRAWAQQLAQAGFPTLRLSFPSTGDSGGATRDPDRVGAWIESVDAGARWLLAETGAARAAVIGIGLGGMMTVLAAGRGAPIEALALWSTQARGRSLVRQLRAFSRLEEAQFFEGLEPPPPLPDGDLEAGGFLLAADTVAALEAIDASTIELASGPVRRALLIERDGIGVDAVLRAHLEHEGLEVATARGPGYGEMTSHPQTARPPLPVIAAVREWLERSSSPAPGVALPSAPVAGAVSSATIRLRDGGAVRETPVAITQPSGRLSGVLVEPLQHPLHGLRLVLLNAGAVRRTGPSRMWVECARRWAANGLSTLRLDVEGIGDSDGATTPYVKDDSLYVPEMVPQVQSAVDFLQARSGGERFILGGLCAGAYWSFHGALRDPRVSAILMLNPRALIWDTGLGPARDLRALLTQPPSLSKIRRLATGPRLQAFVRWLLAAPRRAVRRVLFGEAPAAAAEYELDAALERLRQNGKPSLLLFSAHEPLDDELTRSGRAGRLAAWPTMTLERIAVRDHTMRPNWAQVQAHAILDRAIGTELEREPVYVAEHPPLTA